MIGKDEIKHRFQSAPLSVKYSQQGRVEALRSLFASLATTLDEVLPDGRAKAITFTQLEDVAMWAEKAMHEQSVEDDL